MEFFSVGQQANGFIAIGQEAVGVIAIGQVATGVIAIGQGARGIFAVGMLSVGVVSIGMLSFGLVHSVAMIGVGGRGTGGVLPLCPKLPAKANLPETSPRDALESGRASGWIAAMPQRAPSGFALVEGGRALTARMSTSMISAAAQAFAQGSRVLAYLTPTSQGVTVTRMMKLPMGARLDRAFVVMAAAQLVGLAALASAYFYFGLAPVIDTILALAKS
jgi:hypothetical protein